MELRQYVVDAFSDQLFSGNQAAVCLPSKALAPELMQAIAIENNFSETAFALKTDRGYELRWFTPGGEIDLCGHATLGTAFVIMTEIDTASSKVSFFTKSGPLTVMRENGLYKMNFPQAEYRRAPVTKEMEEAIVYVR